MAPDAPHVLAVDDSLVDRKVIERLLKISSCRVTTVDSGRRALQFLGLDGEQKPVGVDSLKVNLIITDYCMPGMNGYELLKKIKESSTLKEIPVVIMSSENVVARIDRCLEEGAEEFIMKPVKLSDLKRLKGYIAKKQRREEGGDVGKQAQSHKRPLPLSSSSTSSPPPSSTTSSPTPPPPLPPPPSSTTSTPPPPSSTTSTPPPPSSTTSASTPPVSSPSPSSTTSTSFQEHDAITPTSPSSSQPPQKMARLDPQSG